MTDTNKMQISLPQALQMLQQERASLGAVENRIRDFEAVLTETLATKETVQTLVKTADNEKIMVGLGSGVFADATLEGTSKIRITLGGGVISETTPQEAISALETRQKEAQEQLAALSNERNRIMANLNNLTQMARHMQSNRKA